MPQSLSNLLIHVVFSTKERNNWITAEILPHLHAYIATILRDQGCICKNVGGIANHVHIAMQIPRTIAVANIVEKIKTSSSRWIKTNYKNLNCFAWQRGYSAFSVSPRDVNALVAYIDNQANHHKKKSFEEEYRAFLQSYGIAFDELYLWD